MNDLRDLYFTVKAYHAIIVMKEYDRQSEWSHAKDGRYLDGTPSLSNEITFAESINEFCRLCRPLNMELTYNYYLKELDYSLVMNLVFDLAWFALYRIVISVARSAVEYI